MFDFEKETNKLILSERYNGRKDLSKEAIRIAGTDGLYMEFGVAEGQSINFMAKNKVDCIFHGFDSFFGLPEKWKDGFPKGRFSTNGKLPRVEKNVKLYKGLFEETLPSFIRENKENASFIHIDSDLYSSCRYVLDSLVCRIKKGTLLLFDEYYNYKEFKEHEMRAFLEFVEKYNVKYRYIGHVPRGEQCLLIIESIRINKIVNQSEFRDA